jgi:hypothetical protein
MKSGTEDGEIRRPDEPEPDEDDESPALATL